MTRTLVIGDAHIDETQDLRRFKAVGNMVRMHDYNNVVILGDFLSLNSLSDWDKNKRAKMENKRYSKELDAGNRALDLMMTDDRSKFKYIEGNHEDRLTRYLDVDPTFQGQVGIVKDLKLKERGVLWTPYKQVLLINGVGFTHIPIMANGKPISNPNVAQKALKLFHHSVVFGHVHTLDHAAEHRHGSPHLNQALSAGCFFEHVDEYAQGSMTNYWRGVIEIHQYSANRFDIHTTSMSQLLKLYR